MVSIPHRYGKNYESRKNVVSANQVSIPHRYGKNYTSTEAHPYSPLWFPFLIGTVRTPYSYTIPARKLRFPFLIGTVRTELANVCQDSLVKFPFLIGTVRTSAPEYYVFTIVPVSIPHRYGKNLEHT